MVYDDRHRPASLGRDPSLAAMVVRGARQLVGARARDLRSPTATESGWSELRYHHLVPSPEQWAAIRKRRTAGPRPADLITDYSSYNTDVSASDRDAPDPPRGRGSSRTGSAT